MWEKQTSEAQTKYEAGASGGNYFKFKEGKNKIRILVEGEIMATHFVGTKGYTCYGVKEGCPFHGNGAPRDDKGAIKKPSAKLVTYVLDRNTEEQKPQQAEIAYSVVKQINTFAEEKDFAFGKFPMPYDINVTFTKAAAPNDKYKVVPSATRDEVPTEVLDQLSKVPPVSQTIERKKERAMRETGAIVDLEDSSEIGEDGQG